MNQKIPKHDARQVYAVHVYAHHSHTDRNHFHPWRNRSPFHTPLDSFGHQSTLACRCGNLARDICDLGSAASWLFPMVLGDIAGAPCARISSLDAVRAVIALALCVDIDVCLYYPEPRLRVWECSTDYCWKQWNTTDTLCPTSSAIHRCIYPASRRHETIPLKWLKLFNRSMYSSGGMVVA